MGYRSVVFAGGGNRCLWQLGFWEETAEALSLQPEVMVGASAGAAIAALLSSGRGRLGFELFKRLTAENRRNVYPLNALRRRPVFPHLAMYRGTILDVLGEAGAFEQLREGPELRVLISRPPLWLAQRPMSAALLGLMAYQVEKRARNPVHPTAGLRVGFRPEVVTLNALESREAVADAILHSSCTPPITPLFRRGEGPVLDGCLIDNTPLLALKEHEQNDDVLLMLTRPFPRLPQVPGRTYVQPSRVIQVAKFDYTNPKALQRAYDLGRRDGEQFLRGRDAQAA